MNQHYYYLLVDIGCLFIPLLFSFYPRHAFYKHWGRFFKVASAVALFFLIWDEIFTRLGVWGFNEDYLLGFRIGHLPLEELLFFYCIPFACVFTHFALRFLVKSNPLSFLEPYLSRFIISISVVFIILSKGRLYPLFTGIFALLFFVWCYWKKQPLSWLVLAYLCIYPFFLLSNGILTGSGLDAPIVWYNDAENFGIRLMTIPLEDSFYGFLLIAMNVVFFEKMG